MQNKKNLGKICITRKSCPCIYIYVMSITRLHRIYIYMCVCTVCVRAYVCECMSVYVCVSASVRVCMYACVYVELKFIFLWLEWGYCKNDFLTTGTRLEPRYLKKKKSTKILKFTVWKIQMFFAPISYWRHLLLFQIFTLVLLIKLAQLHEDKTFNNNAI